MYFDTFLTRDKFRAVCPHSRCLRYSQCNAVPSECAMLRPEQDRSIGSENSECITILPGTEQFRYTYPICMSFYHREYSKNLLPTQS